MAYGTSTGVMGQKWGPLGPTAPADWSEFERDTGKTSRASANDYNIWKATKNKNENARAETLQNRADMQNFINTNASPAQDTANTNRLNALLSDPNSIDQSAAYKFRFNQGAEAVNRSAAAKGMLGSGNRLMELTKYGQDMGSQEYDNQFNRLNSLVTQGKNDRLGWGQLYEQGRQANMGNALDKAKSNIGGFNPGYVGQSYAWGGY